MVSQEGIKKYRGAKMKSGKIKKVRLALGLTQKEFAARIGMQTSGAVCLLEKGRRTPPGPVLLLLHDLHRQSMKENKIIKKTGNQY